MPVVRAKYAGIGVSEEFLTLRPSCVKDQRRKKGGGEDWRGLARTEGGLVSAGAARQMAKLRNLRRTRYGKLFAVWHQTSSLLSGFGMCVSTAGLWEVLGSWSPSLRTVAWKNANIGTELEMAR